MADDDNEQSKPEIALGTLWRHYNGNIYQVILITNEHGTNEEKYPVTICYRGANGRIWSRKKSDWHRSMTFVERQTLLPIFTQLPFHW